jgi:mono/diheme cytochrome c family protein
MIACAGERDLVEPGVTLADVRLGKQAFEQSCSGCHASRDGFDLKVFGFSDTTIVRRAVHHVDTVTARNIVAYIRTLEVPARW